MDVRKIIKKKVYWEKVHGNNNNNVWEIPLKD